MDERERTGDAVLSIGDLAERTGVSTATLRTWETRFGFPEPVRRPGGHRRYTERHVAEIGVVLRLRAQGLGVHGAIEQARATPTAPHQSVVGALRATHPHLRSQPLSKRTLLALTHAMEDESAARAQRPVLFATFQEVRFYEEARRRYTDLARTAERVVVLADFDRHGGVDEAPVRVAVPPDSPVRREWVLVCQSATHQACLAGWEVPGQAGVPDRDRRFETVWSTAPDVVLAAARACTDILAAVGDEEVRALAGELAQRWDDEPVRAADPQSVTGLLDRALHYLDAR
jgi:DICT domain-containing protein